MDDIVNKVAGSGLMSIDLEELNTSGERILFDLQPHLFQGLILKEKDFRDFVKTHHWSEYNGKIVGIICSSDAIVPTWAYMLVALALEPFAKRIFFAGLQEIEMLLFAEKLASIDPKNYTDARIVIKGCGDKPVPTNAFVQISTLLKPYAKSIMFGEPCSTVPLYKAPKKTE